VGGYGDPAALDALAWELSQRARSVRAVADQHRRDGARARWVSEAASVYRRQLATDCAAVDAAADAMDEAAEVLRRHADEVRDRLAAIARAEREVRAWLADQASKVGDLADDVGSLLGALPEAGADAWRDVSRRLTRLGAW
jgi:ABC-type transporter Mla subunit MlaD